MTETDSGDAPSAPWEGYTWHDGNGNWREQPDRPRRRELTTEQRFWLMDMDGPTADGPLIGIVDEKMGGIIAYACGEENADRILRLLRKEAGSE